jgi:Uma2 family endonuclease
MSALPKPSHSWSEEEYLTFERASNTKHEYYDGAIYDMVGGTARHSQIAANAIISLSVALRGRGCRIYTSDLRVKMQRSYTYPDVIVVCGEPRFTDASEDTLINPTLIVEVLSPSTEHFDRNEKFRRYQQVESVQTYLLIAQETARLEQYVRQPDQRWLYSLHEGLESVVALPTFDCNLPLAEVYENVVFTPSPNTE